MLKRYGDLSAGIFSAMTAVVLYISSTRIKQFDTSGVGADFVPKIVAVLLFILSAILIMRGAAIARRESGESNEKPCYFAVALSLLLMIVYTAILSHLGFILTTAFYLFSQMCVVSTKEKTNLVKFAIIAAVASVAIYLLFVHVFGILLPPGILG